MIRSLAILFSLCALSVPLVFSNAVAGSAEADIAGGWFVEWSTPWGPTENPMWVVQNGSRLTGRVSAPGIAEYPLKGTTEGERFRVVWQAVIDGEWVDVVFAGTVKGDVISGTAKIGTLREGELYGERTGR